MTERVRISYYNRPILGVDPGLSGALALYFPSGVIHFEGIPTLHIHKSGRKARRRVDFHALGKLLQKSTVVERAYVELVNAMPGQGVTSMFSFGMTYGSILQGLADQNIPFQEVTPRVWKRVLKVKKGKGASRLKASELFPRYSEQWNTGAKSGFADAALIAYYGYLDLTGRI